MDQICLNRVVLQRLSQVLADTPRRSRPTVVATGDARPSAKDTMRLLADLRSWLSQHAVTAVDCNAQRASDFLQERYRRCRPYLKDRAALRRWLEHLRDHGVIPLPVVDTDPHAGDSWWGVFALPAPPALPGPTSSGSLLESSSFSVSGVARSRRLRGAMPPRHPRCMVRKARCSRPSHAKVCATALRRVAVLFSAGRWLMTWQSGTTVQTGAGPPCRS